jgi:2,3,4,5-tetrahydropyridine-2-carboxylate N-succinyltransferase
MRIGVNALYLIPGGVGGTEIYLRNLLRALAGIDSSNEYVIFTNRETGPDLVPERFAHVPLPVRAVNRPARLLYEQTGLAMQARQPWFDKATYPVKRFDENSGVRIVPGGSSIRDGCYVGKGVTCMPPMYINAGAYVGDGTMVDSHALIGSCAQIGARCHISAAAQIGGVLEPVGALPVIVEDDVLVGGNCGVYEGAVVKSRAVLGTGTILNRSTPVYDLVRGEVISATESEPLVIPEGAVVVAGSRTVTSGKGKEWGIALYTPVIVKYRDAKTDAKIQLEDLLR